jgi:ubiquinone/menaquinone biosynthesis C-methylase UbiE
MNDDAEARKAQMKAIFDRLAPEYDAAGPGCFAYFGRRLVQEVGIEPGQRVLDVASGRGAVLFAAAEQVGPTGTVVGIDLAEGMVRAANEEASRRGLGAPVRVMDAERLDFRATTFSRVLCGFGLMFFPHLDRALSEFRRVLEPGGRIGISTWQVSQADDVRVVLDELGLGGPGEPGWITDPDELAGLLQRAELPNVKVKIDSKTFRYADLDEYWQTARGTGQRRRLDVLKPEETERVRAALADRVKRHHRVDGIYLEATALLARAER